MADSVESKVSPLGRPIDSFRVIGDEVDGETNWVGADMLLRVRGAGNFLLTVVTKQRYLDEKLEESLDTEAALEKLLHEGIGPTEVAPAPFVLNDSVITQDLLDRKFNGRIVEEDLAPSLYYVVAD